MRRCGFSLAGAAFLLVAALFLVATMPFGRRGRLVSGAGHGVLVRGALSRSGDRKRRDLRSQPAHGGASRAAVRRPGQGDPPDHRRVGGRGDQRPRTLHRRPRHRPLQGGGARARHHRGRARPGPDRGRPAAARGRRAHPDEDQQRLLIDARGAQPPRPAASTSSPCRTRESADLVAQLSARLGQVLVAVVRLHPELGCCFQRRRVPSAAPHAASLTIALKVSTTRPWLVLADPSTASSAARAAWNMA